jgi:hypothetical protein
MPPECGARPIALCVAFVTPVLVAVCVLCVRGVCVVCARGVCGVGEQGVEGFTLGELVDRHVMEHAEAIAKMASEAVQEGLLEESLQKVLCFLCTGALVFFPCFVFRMRCRLCRLEWYVCAVVALYSS